MTEPRYYLATVRGQADVLVWGPDESRLYLTAERIHQGRWHDEGEITDLRAVVLLDPDALPDALGSPERLRTSATTDRAPHNYVTAALKVHLADLIEAQTTPPVAEPTGLGAVVRDAAGRVLVRRDLGGDSPDPAPWLTETEDWYGWDNLPRPVEVLSEGWTEGDR